MRGYLLDTNILAYWFNGRRPEHAKTVERLNLLDADTPLRISTVSLGEIEYGHRCVSGTDTVIQVAFKQFIWERFPDALDIRRTTSIYYGQIRAKLFSKFGPKKSKRPCQLIDPATATTLGIQENDLWIAAQAAEYNIVLVTHDRGMRRIQEVASDLLDFEDWAT